MYINQMDCIGELLLHNKLLQNIGAYNNDLSLQFLWVGIQEQFSWETQAQDLRWGLSQDVDQDCSRLKAWQAEGSAFKVQVDPHDCN